MVQVSWRSLLLRFLWSAMSLVLLLALVIAALYWLGGREATLQQLLQTAAHASGGKLTVDGVTGSLYSKMHVARVRYEDEKRRAILENITLDWSPRSLLGRELVLNEVAVGRIDFTVKQASDEPPAPPASLRLPLTIRAPRVAVDQLQIESGGNTTTFNAVQLAVDSTGAKHHLRIANADTPWGKLKGQATLAADLPFALTADAELTGATAMAGAPRAFTLAAKASGPLAKLSISASASISPSASTSAGALSDPASIAARATVNSFAAMPLQTLALDAHEVNLQALRHNLPLTALNATLDGKIDDDGTLAGNLTAANALPGRVDAGKLPFKSLAAAVSGKLSGWQATALRLDLAEAGQFTGTASGKNAAIELALSTGNLNLNGIQTSLKPTRLAGDIKLGVPNAESQHIVADLAQKPLRIRLDATRDGDKLRLARATLASGVGELAISGELELSGKRKYEASGKLANFNPADFGKLPPARINATLMSRGELAPAPAGNLQFTLLNSQWRGQPLAGHGRLEFAWDRIAGVDVELTVAPNHLTAMGALGRVGDQLAWMLAAPRFQDIDPSLAGSLSGSGQVQGSFTEPAFDFKLAGNGLTLPGGQRIESLRGHGNLSSGQHGAVNAELIVQGLNSGRFNLASANLTVNGTRDQHTLVFTATEPRLIDLTLQAAGGWNARRGWAGTLQRLVNQGDYAISLQAPTRIAIGPNHAEASQLVLLAAGGELAVKTLNWSAGNLATSGALRGLSFAYLQKLFPEQLRASDMATTLKLGGDWDLHIGDTVDGRLHLGREEGDIIMLTEPKLPLDITALELTTEARNNKITANMAIAGSAIGAVGGNLATVVERRNGSWGIPGTAPLEYTVTADVPSLAWLALFVGDRIAVDGQAQLSFAHQGSMANGRYNGKLEGNRLSFHLPEYGIALDQGVLAATFDGAKLSLEQFTMHAKRGTLSASGAFNLGKETAEGGVQVRADKLAILDHPDYQLSVSGEGQVALKNGGLAVTGRVRADEGQITLPQSNAPSLGADVVVVGGNEAAPKRQAATPLQIDVELDLGDNFQLRGRGIDAQLAGQLRVRSTPAGVPSGSGAIRVVKGTYEAYGQKLTIDRGILSFAGPINNPGLDILAARKNLAVEAGVAITGTALSPRVRLVSTPPVADSEKLAWLTLGHGLEGVSGSEVDVLTAAATAFASRGGGPSFTDRIARAVGLDEIGVNNSSTTSASGSIIEQRALTLGKRISSRLFLSYEMGIGGAARIAKLQYELSRRWSVRAQAGTQSAVDLFYTLSFD